MIVGDIDLDVNYKDGGTCWQKYWIARKSKHKVRIFIEFEFSSQSNDRH